MAHHRGAGGAAAPVAAGAVVAGRERRAVGLRAGENVVAVRRVAAAVDRRTLLAQRVLLAELVVRAVQVGDAGGDHRALGVLPGTLADAVLGVDRVGALGAQIGAPSLAGRAGGGSELGAMRVGAIQAAEVAAL